MAFEAGQQGMHAASSGKGGLVITMDPDSTRAQLTAPAYFPAINALPAGDKQPEQQNEMRALCDFIEKQSSAAAGVVWFAIGSNGGVGPRRLAVTANQGGDTRRVTVAATTNDSRTW